MSKRLSDFRRSLNEDLPATQFVGGFPRKHVSVVASAPGVGKTWFVLKTAMDLSKGGTVFLGLSYGEPAAKSVIMCGEAGLETLVERVKLLNQPYYQERVAIYTMADLAAEEIPICLDDKEGIDNLRKIIVGEEADIVFIDSLIAFRSDDENASKETSRLLNSLIGVARKTDTAIVITHHIRKRKRKDDGETTQDDIIGSSAITRLCATAWIMTKDPKSVFTKLSCAKSWWEKPPVLYWNIKKTKSGIELQKGGITNYTEARETVDRYLQAQPKNELISIADIMEETSADVMIIQAELERYQKLGKGTIITAEAGGYGIMLYTEAVEV